MANETEFGIPNTDYGVQADASTGTSVTLSPAQAWRSGKRPHLGTLSWSAAGRWLTATIGTGSYIFLYVPIIILIVFSFNASRFGQSWDGFSLRWYEALFADRLIGRALRATLLVATVSTAVSTTLGTLVALAMERYRFRGKLALDTLLYLPIVIPDIAMALMLLLFFSMMSMRLGPTTVILSHIAFNISFVAVVVRARLAHLDPTLEEAARDLYANEWQTFRRVTLPLILPGVMGGALLAFTLSLDDAVITSFTTGPGFTTLPVRVLGQAKTGITPEINALSTLMLLGSMTLLLLSRLVRRGDGAEIDLV